MRAFANLRGNANFMTVMEFIENCRDRTDNEGRNQPEEYRLRWNQGATQDLTELMKLFEESKQM